VGSGREAVGLSSVNSSSPMATTRPPEDTGTLVRIGEADGGNGFRFTGEGLLLLTLDDRVRNAENEGMSTEGCPNCFKRESVGRVGAMLRPFCRPAFNLLFFSHDHESRRSTLHARRGDQFPDVHNVLVPFGGKERRLSWSNLVACTATG
jgi:hypothetical protein